jgi:hypothetical protein
MPYLLKRFILAFIPILLVSQVSDGMENSGDDQIEVEWGDRNRLRGRVGSPVYDETAQWSGNHEYRNVKAHTKNSSGSSNNSTRNNNNNYSNNTNNNTKTSIGLSSGRTGHFSKADSGVSGNFNSHTSNVESSRGVGINTIEHAYLPSTLSSLQSQSQPQHSSNSSSSSSVSSSVTSRDDRSSSFRISSADNALLFSAAIGMKNIKENGNDEDDLMKFLLDDTNF